MPPRHHSSTQVNKNPMACKLPVMALFCGRHSAKQSRWLLLGATLHGANAAQMKLDSKQPWGVWAFVIGLNVVGVIGYFILQAKGITLQSIHAG